MSLSLWEKVKQPPQWALKQIQAGRLKGKSDVSPVWRYQALTEQFGPCGLGWRYTIENLWTTPGTDNEIVAHARVSLYVKVDHD